MKWRRAILGTLAAGFVLLLLGGWGLWHWRYPYGRSHYCLKSIFLALNVYAQEHGGLYPDGQSSPEASLALLCKEGLLDADTFRGKTAKAKRAGQLLGGGSLTGPESCGWHYVQGLNRSDDGRIAVLWDKLELGHFGERHKRPGREVLTLGGDCKWITRAEWGHFQSEQESLLKIRKGIATNNAVFSNSDRPRSKTESPGSNLSGTLGEAERPPAADVLLAVKFHLQEHPLSCEAAALTMALRFQEARITETEVISRMPFDKTPHSGSVWGDPDKGFVGNIDGKIPVDGYGIHCKPLAETARRWRRAEVIEGGSPQEVARHVLAGRPVIVWGFTGKGGPLTWQTPGGKTVHADVGEHTRVVCGFRGAPADPDGFFLIDPNCGLVYWPKRLFVSNWDALNRSGVVIYQ
jgi:uncharacterized protein YvpB